MGVRVRRMIRDVRYRHMGSTFGRYYEYQAPAMDSGKGTNMSVCTLQYLASRQATTNSSSIASGSIAGRCRNDNDRREQKSAFYVAIALGSRDLVTHRTYASEPNAENECTRL